MEELTYHNQLLVKNSIQNGTQWSVIKLLLKTGLTSLESQNLFRALYSTVQLNPDQKSNLLQLIGQLILNDEVRRTIINYVGS